MTLFALVLILISAVAHATWNFLTKRTITQELFIWSMIISISIALIPLAIILLIGDPIVSPGWWFILGTVILHAIYFVLLARSYTYADLSLVYPIARGIGPALVPILSVLVLNEVVTSLAIVGIITIIVGIFIVYWWGQVAKIIRDPFMFLRDTGIRYAVLTGLVNSVQSIWDKVGVRYVNPFLYMYLLALGSAIVLAPYMLRFHGIKAIRIEWRRNLKIIPIAGLLMFLAYSLVLLALQFTQVSYIIPAREVGIVIGVVLGSILLKEPFGKGRIIGSCFIALGVTLIYIS